MYLCLTSRGFHKHYNPTTEMSALSNPALYDENTLFLQRYDVFIALYKNPLSVAATDTKSRSHLFCVLFFSATTFLGEYDIPSSELFSL